MSTSASYIINGQVEFYTNYNGYESGAANRFIAALHSLSDPINNPEDYRIFNDVRGGFKYAMIRANNDIEPSNQIECDYIYNITIKNNGSIFLDMVRNNVLESRQEIHDFINESIPGYDFIKITEDGVFGLHTRYVSRDRAEFISKCIKDKALNFNTDNSNHHNYMKLHHVWGNQCL